MKTLSPKPMKRTIHIAMSLDGYIADSDGSTTWLENLGSDPSVTERVFAFIASSDLIVMGRKTYDHILTFPEWPYPGKHVIVVSDTLQQVATPDTVIATREALFATMVATGAQNIWIVGGGLLNTYMIMHGWVDLLVVSVAPILLGKGLPLFGGLEQQVPLQLQEVVSLGHGFVELSYTRPLPC